MPRTKRMYTAGVVCHVLNRAVGRAEIFASPADYATFEEQLAAACEAVPVRLFTFCLMPNHWHLVLWPQAERDLSVFMHRLTMPHTLRWHQALRLVHQHQPTMDTTDTPSGEVYDSRFELAIRVRDKSPHADERVVFASAILPAYLRKSRFIEELIPDNSSLFLGGIEFAMKIFCSPEYWAAGYEFDRTRKARWLLDSLASEPMPGVDVVPPPLLGEHAIAAAHDPGYVATIWTGDPRELAETNCFPWDPGVWTMAVAHTSGMVAAARQALCDGGSGSFSTGCHHARRDTGKGFCTFNGLAIAAHAIATETA